MRDLDPEHELYVRDLGDGRAISVIPLTYDRARITIGPDNLYTYDDGW